MDVGLFNTELNEAHQHARMAESFNAKQLYTEAIECHQNAADNLKKARTLTSSIEALKSIDLQISYHERQVLVVEEKLRRANDLSTSTIEGDASSTTIDAGDFGFSSDSQPYATLDLRHDTMMGNILRERNFSAPGDLAARALSNKMGQLNVKKIVKDDRTVIEEQATTIKLLRDHISVLELEKDSLKQELNQAHKEIKNIKVDNKSLRERLSKYEPSSEVGLVSGTSPAVNDLPSLDISRYDFEVIPGGANVDCKTTAEKH